MPQISPLVTGDPAHLGSFRLSGRIGEGGQGIVYLGVNDKGERAAIKLLHVKFSGDTIARSRFARELKAAQRVASFCTARVIEADLDGNTPYIASEYIDGLPLREIVETDGPLTGTVLDRLAIGTATALTAIHHAAIVHRDFKPDNVLIAADGPRVVDFGIARIIDSTGTITSRAIGTPAYMAPEQIAGDDVGPYTDVFSWGATIAFAATGKQAFEGNSIAVVLNRILNHQVDVGMMPEPLQGVVRSALAKSPADRPSADQILLRLLGQPSTVGASTAVLTRGVQVASDDTTPFSRVSAGSITDLPSRKDAAPAAPPSRNQPAPNEPARNQPAPNEPARNEPARNEPVRNEPVRNEAAVTTPPEAAPYQLTEPATPARSRRAKVWIALATAVVLLAAAGAALAMKGWPLAFGEQPEPSETANQELPGTFATVVDKVAQTGKVVIGVKGDLPGVGLQDGGGFEGFDVEVARRIAAELGAKDPEFVQVSRDTRASALADGEVDLVVATYSVDNSETQFAGPYYLAHHDVLVRAGSGIDSLDDLAGKKLCAPDSPSVGEVQDKVKVEPVSAGNYALCMDRLRSGEVDAIPGDDLILAGFAARENMRYKILGARLNNERYAVGIRNGDVKTCKAVKAVIVDLYRTGFMKQLLTRHFARVDFKPELKVPAMETC
ncbi:transporter substrate-binding domain-containing protein [Nonomuraea sp. NPDC049695]|uniref:protein kinase domain-containing protein n=1 Tax=Nonomuraea sp. NPDC049695 TaxID=3154734 RepID=UPI003414B74F